MLLLIHVNGKYRGIKLVHWSVVSSRQVRKPETVPGPPRILQAGFRPKSKEDKTGFTACEAYLVSGGRGVHRGRAGGHEGHGRLLGEVDRCVQGAGRVDEGREHLEFGIRGGR